MRKGSDISELNTYVPWKNSQQICEKEGAYNLEKCEHSRVFCTEWPLFAAKQ